jgi:hypothetical protein
VIALIFHAVIASLLLLTLEIIGDPVVTMDPRLPTPADIERARQREARIATWREAARRKRNKSDGGSRED